MFNKSVISTILIIVAMIVLVLLFGYNYIQNNKLEDKISKQISLSQVSNLISTQIEESKQYQDQQQYKAQNFKNQEDIQKMYTAYYTGTLGESKIALRIGKNPKITSSVDAQFGGEYIYVGINDEYIRIQGDLKSATLELKENDTTTIKLDLINQSGTWTNGSKTLPIKLENSNINTVGVALEQKNKIVKTEFFDLNCETSGKLRVGSCQVVDKSGNSKGEMKVFGFPISQVVKDNYTEVIFDFKGYGICSYSKFNVDNNSFEIKEVRHSSGKESCNLSF
jgi:hypothetical protein